SDSTADTASLLKTYGIERDPRFIQARQEAKIVFMYMFANVVFFIAVSYWGKLSYNGSYDYILNMPPYFLVIIIGALVSISVGAVIGLYYIEDVSLEAWR